MPRGNVQLQRSRQPGQAVIEYAGAMIVAAVIVGAIVSGTGTNSWITNSYNSIFSAAGNIIGSKANTLPGN